MWVSTSNCQLKPLRHAAVLLVLPSVLLFRRIYFPCFLSTPHICLHLCVRFGQPVWPLTPASLSAACLSLYKAGFSRAPPAINPILSIDSHLAVMVLNSFCSVSRSAASHWQVSCRVFFFSLTSGNLGRVKSEMKWQGNWIKFSVPCNQNTQQV